MIAGIRISWCCEAKGYGGAQAQGRFRASHGGQLAGT